MNIEEIKVGETYYVRVKVTATSENRFVSRPLLRGDTMSDFAPNYFNFAEAEAFYKSIPETTPPKHDPCRRFRTGDKVRIKSVNGRCQSVHADAVGNVVTVVRGEPDNATYVVIPPYNQHIDVAYIELVTPIEEFEPYSVETNQHGYHIEDCRKEKIVATYNDELHPNAYEAAVAECKRLNEEWRKEQNNG